MHFLRFAEAGLFRRCAPGRRYHGILTWTLCELTALFRDILSSVPETWREAKALCERLSDWLKNDFHKLFGESSTSKLHLTVFHLQDELLLRANMFDGNTWANKALHKYIKRALSADKQDASPCCAPAGIG